MALRSPNRQSGRAQTIARTRLVEILVVVAGGLRHALRVCAGVRTGAVSVCEAPRATVRF